MLWFVSAALSFTFRFLMKITLQVPINVPVASYMKLVFVSMVRAVHRIKSTKMS